MAAVPSTMLPLGTPAPRFVLADAASGAQVGTEHFRDARALLVMFICNHCPYVRHVMGEFVRIQRDYRDDGLQIVAINANDLEAYPQDGPEQMKALAEALGWDFPYLFDATQDVARAFRAACTPDFFLFDGGRRLVYRGQFDSARPGNDVPVTGGDVRAAIEATLAGKPVPPDQTASIGCNIKWSKGNEPDYFAR
ncbi:MAG: thioredoxin family protein [Gemmatimonadota bacterium]|nr:thioredoxin family protein [Gemmatimonadota bacterium]MDH5196108.1 thioredoxin family protein [Gemmatimonadota bacterium]